ncbi:MAG: family 43 glycosylhydrolase, partial [Bdellovibrionales bacterium]|nr:family 43 glycosylhydrolase [Bdellovibrionales bacterium]
MKEFDKSRDAFIKRNAAIFSVSTLLMVALAFQNCGQKAEELAVSVAQNSGITDQALLSPNSIVNLNKKNGAVHLASANPNGQPVVRFDRDGHAIDAHDGEIKLFGSKYYLYGTSYSCGFEYLSQGTKPFCGFKSYSSTDLVHWDDEGLMFPPSLLAAACSANGCFRPHVLFNAKTGKYVLWINVSEGGVGYRVFTSSSPTGPFSLVNASPKLLRPSGGGDHNLFLDDDGTAYLIYSNYGMATEAFKIVIEKLNADFTDSTGIYARFPSGGEGETMFKRGSTYYVVFDGGCAYCPNGTTHYGTALNPLGPWTYRGSLSSD